MVTNAGARPGDLLILTKPLGVGIIVTAAKLGEDKLGAVRDATELMTTLNRKAAEVITAIGAHALTDVTGFGLLGHLRNMTAASGVSAQVWLDNVPVLPAAWEYVREGIAPGGTHANLRFLADWVSYAESLGKEEQLILADAQTSGGLLAAVSAETAGGMIDALGHAGVKAAAVIGRLEAGEAGRITVVRSR
jgi:selenide,water dikinase